MGYFTRQDLEDALGKQTVSAIFDEDASGQADDRPIASCIAYATAECNSFLRAVYSVTLPLTTVPDEIKYAALDFGCAYAMRRRPDLVRAMNEESWTTFRDSAIEKMKRFLSAEQRMSTATPNNVGASVGNTAEQNVRSSVGEERQKRWEDMGDYS